MAGDFGKCFARNPAVSALIKLKLAWPDYGR